MFEKKIRRAAFAAAAVCILGQSAVARPVIPGAIGFGMDTPAGRSGEVIRVTNLKDSGSGSLRACVNASGPRICVFEISGTIRLKENLVVSNPNLTIAGQTAPSPGIMLRGAALQISASDVLVQHIAMRVGDDPDGPSFDSRDSLKIISKNTIRNIVVDHCSISWGIDENLEVWDSWDNVTISNTIISEGLRKSFHPKGAHGLGVLIQTKVPRSRIAMFGNLMAHSFGRNPRSSATDFVLVNNVVYNGRDSEAMLYNDYGLTSKNAVVGNVFIKGPDSHDSIKPIRLTGPSSLGTEILLGTKLYLADNVAPSATDDPWSIVDNQTPLTRLVLELTELPVWSTGIGPVLPEVMVKPDEVVDYVLANAGTRPGERNDVDARIVSDVRNRTGRIINCVADDGTSRCAKNAGGWPKLAENVRRLDVPENPGGDDDGDGYTNVEEWLHGFAARVEGRASPPRPPELRTQN